MKLRSLLPCAIMLLCLCAAAQQNARSGAVRVQGGDETARKAVMVTGRVSSDGKVLVSEDDDRWTVNNPSMLAAHAGSEVTVKCQLSADQNSIHVLAVKAVETKYVAAHSDAAFRR